MQIDYNEKSKKLYIKDDLKTQYLLIKITMFVLLSNAIIILLTASFSNFGTLDYLWIILGSVATYLLYILIVKRSTANELLVSEIEYLRIKTMQNRSQFSLQLKNGKQRNLAIFSNSKDEKQLLELCNKAGIKKQS